MNVRIATTAEDIAALDLHTAAQAASERPRLSGREIAKRWAYEEGSESGYEDPIRGPWGGGYHVPHLRAEFDRGYEDGAWQRYLEDCCCWRH